MIIILILMLIIIIIIIKDIYNYYIDLYTVFKGDKNGYCLDKLGVLI